MQAVEIIVNNCKGALTLDERRPAPGFRLDPGAEAQGQGVGIGGEAVLIDLFIAKPGFAERLEGDVPGVRHPGRRERQQDHKGAGHG